MKKYENGEYLELSADEINSVKKEESEYLLSGNHDETDSDLANTIKETAKGKAIVLKDISPLTEKLMIKVNGNYVSGRVVYKLGQNVWDEVCEYSSSGLYLYSKNFVHVAPETNYYLYCNSPVFAWEENVGIFTEITFYDNAEQELSNMYDVHRNSVITTPADCCYIKFKLYEQYGNTYNNDICINVSDKRVNGTYEAYYEEDAYEASIDGNIAILKPDYPVVTIFTEDIDVSLECEYNKDISGVLNTKQDKVTWELISSDRLTEEVSSLAIDGFSCSKIALYIAIKGSANNSAETSMQLRTNKTTAVGGGSNTSLTRMFRTDPNGSATPAQIFLEMQKKWITGHLFNSSVKENYINTTEYDSISGLYLQPTDSDIVFGVGTTYELWGVKE